jgi:hypothetical protein
MTTTESRADRFARELADLKISDPAKGHPRLWQNAGVALMIAGIALGVTGYLVSQRTGDQLTASTAINMAIGGLIRAGTGSAVFLRYSLTGFLRFWLARQSFELHALAERGLAEGLVNRSGGAHARTGANSALPD